MFQQIIDTDSWIELASYCLASFLTYLHDCCTFGSASSSHFLKERGTSLQLKAEGMCFNCQETVDTDSWIELAI